MAAPFRPLPPGVYFNPTAEECVRDYIKPYAADKPLKTDRDRVICDVDIYSDSPAALLRGREPGFSRGFDYKWLLLSRGGKTAAGRGKREVATGGSWQSEQTPKGVRGTADGEEGGEDEDEQPSGGRRRSFGFYVGKKGRKRGEKTPWLMEEFTVAALDDDGTFPVFCRIYLSPRLEKEDKEKKRRILGDDMVAFDRHGKLKPVMAMLSPESFNAAAQEQEQDSAPPRVLEFQQSQPESAWSVLGHEQGQPPLPPVTPFLEFRYQEQELSEVLRRFLGHQTAATPAVLGDHDGGQGMMQWGFPAQNHGHAAAAPHQLFLGYHQGQATLQCECGPDQYCGAGAAVLPQLLHVPQQGEAMTHTEKKPRLLYGSPASSCMIQIHDDDNQWCADPVVTTPPPPQEIPGTATAGSAEAEPPCYVSAPAPAELADDAGKAGAKLMLDPGLYVDLAAGFEPFSDPVIPCRTSW